MPFSIYTVKVLAIAEILHRWIGVLTGLDRSNRERIADFAEMIAATLARAAAAIAAIEVAPDDGQARAVALTELGRITGYVETIVAVLEHHLDGRKIAGIKRRLESLGAARLAHDVAIEADGGRADHRAKAGHRPGPRLSRTARLRTAEGYFRALADGLRA